MTPPLPEVDNSAELRTCLRDLISLLGLPALWSSKEPQATARLLAETLIETLSLDACCVTTTFVRQNEPQNFLYANGKAVDIAKASGWMPFVEASVKEQHELSLTQEATPIGMLYVARFSLGYYGYKGWIAVASSRQDFPKPTELILLRSAASLAASGLRSASLTYEREKALRAKDEFLAMLGHELRNPLAPIVSALDLIKLKAGGQLTLEHKIIERQVNHLNGLVDDLLDVTRITSGKIELKQQTIEVHSVVLAALEAAQPLIEQRRHHVLCDIPVSGLLITGDPLRLAQSVSNLLINAAKYTDPDGTITVTTLRDGSNVALQVKDTGTGIDADLLPHVFDLFEQGKVSIDRSQGGLGIGLSIVKSLINMHGGTVTAESAGIGLGSTFTISLPLTGVETPKSAVKQLAAAMATASKRERILIVDDNREAADILSSLLQAYGYEVHVKYTPLDALDFCKKIDPAIVMIDIGLPVISGYELATRIRAKFRENPPRIMAITGYGQPQDHQRSLEAGIEVHLTKPVPIETLIAKIQKRI